MGLEGNFVPSLTDEAEECEVQMFEDLFEEFVGEGVDCGCADGYLGLWRDFTGTSPF